MQLRLDAIDDLQRVLSLPHDHDPGNNFAVSIQVGDSPAQVRSQHHLAYILDSNRCAGFAGHQCDILEILHGLGRAASAHHVFSAAELQQAAADLTVPAAHRLDHTVDGNSVGLQTAGVDIDLILLPEAAQRSNFSHAGH